MSVQQDPTTVNSNLQSLKTASDNIDKILAKNDLNGCKWVWWINTSEREDLNSINTTIENLQKNIDDIVKSGDQDKNAVAQAIKICDKVNSKLKPLSIWEGTFWQKAAKVIVSIIGVAFGRYTPTISINETSLEEKMKAIVKNVNLGEFKHNADGIAFGDTKITYDDKGDYEAFGTKAQTIDEVFNVVHKVDASGIGKSSYSPLEYGQLKKMEKQLGENLQNQGDYMLFASGDKGTLLVKPKTGEDVQKIEFSIDTDGKIEVPGDKPKHTNVNALIKAKQGTQQPAGLDAPSVKKSLFKNAFEKLESDAIQVPGNIQTKLNSYIDTLKKYPQGKFRYDSIAMVYNDGPKKMLVNFNCKQAWPEFGKSDFNVMKYTTKPQEIVGSNLDALQKAYIPGSQKIATIKDVDMFVENEKKVDETLTFNLLISNGTDSFRYLPTETKGEEDSLKSLLDPMITQGGLGTELNGKWRLHDATTKLDVGKNIAKMILPSKVQNFLGKFTPDLIADTIFTKDPYSIEQVVYDEKANTYELKKFIISDLGEGKVKIQDSEGEGVSIPGETDKVTELKLSEFRTYFPESDALETKIDQIKESSQANVQVFIKGMSSNGMSLESIENPAATLAKYKTMLDENLFKPEDLKGCACLSQPVEVDCGVQMELCYFDAQNIPESKTLTIFGNSLSIEGGDIVDLGKPNWRTELMNKLGITVPLVGIKSQEANYNKLEEGALPVKLWLEGLNYGSAVTTEEEAQTKLEMRGKDLGVADGLFEIWKDTTHGDYHLSYLKNGKVQDPLSVKIEVADRKNPRVTIGKTVFEGESYKKFWANIKDKGIDDTGKLMGLQDVKQALKDIEGVRNALLQLGGGKWATPESKGDLAAMLHIRGFYAEDKQGLYVEEDKNNPTKFTLGVFSLNAKGGLDSKKYNLDIGGSNHGKVEITSDGKTEVLGDISKLTEKFSAPSFKTIQKKDAPSLSEEDFMLERLRDKGQDVVWHLEQTGSFNFLNRNTPIYMVFQNNTDGTLTNVQDEYMKCNEKGEIVWNGKEYPSIEATVNAIKEKSKTDLRSLIAKQNIMSLNDLKKLSPRPVEKKTEPTKLTTIDLSKKDAKKPDVLPKPVPVQTKPTESKTVQKSQEKAKETGSSLLDQFENLDKNWGVCTADHFETYIRQGVEDNVGFIKNAYGDTSLEAAVGIRKALGDTTTVPKDLTSIFKMKGGAAANKVAAEAISSLSPEAVGYLFFYNAYASYVKKDLKIIDVQGFNAKIRQKIDEIKKDPTKKNELITTLDNCTKALPQDTKDPDAIKDRDAITGWVDELKGYINGTKVKNKKVTANIVWSSEV